MPDGAAKSTLEITVHYTGAGFQHFAADPAAGAIPGRCRKLSATVKAMQGGYTWLVTLKDANGKTEVNGKKLEFVLKTEPGKWAKTEFAVPADWAQPLTVVAIAGHNWDQQAAKADAVLRVADLTVETDIAAVKDRRTLVHFACTTDALANVFVEGEPVKYVARADSWLGKELAGKLSYSVTGPDGSAGVKESRPVAFTAGASEPVNLTPARFGVYQLHVALELDGTPALAQDVRFGYVPRPHDYTPPEKLASPWGLNIHGGAGDVPYAAYARVGFTWLRDYAWGREWMARARGDDHKYAGWPYYRKMEAGVRDSGLLLLACMQGSMSQAIKAGNLTPDKAWKADMLGFMLDFANPAWELDNEYDYGNGREEAARDWKSYDDYHQVFGGVVRFAGDKILAVANGTAGIHPDWVRRSIARGAFDNIDVVNGHFYCGTAPPELSTEDANVGGQHTPALLWDSLRDFVAAARADGRPRQAWITEFGWDTLAGHIVSEADQAAYLQRGFLLQLQAGIDKAFWYWNRDTREKPKQFFDGCGIFTGADEPKPAAAAMAGLAHFLKRPQPVGTFDLGPNTFGHVFRDGGKLTACAFTLTPDARPDAHEFPNGKLFDMYANALPGKSAGLSIAPVWIVDLPESDPIYLQTAYELTSLHMVTVAAGDSYTIELAIRNNRQTPITANVEATGPKAWKIEPAAQDIAVAVGQTTTMPMKVTIDPRAQASESTVVLTVKEAGVTKSLPTRFLVLPAAEIKVNPLTGPPGAVKLSAKLTNRSRAARSFVITPQTPKGWKISPDKLAVADVPAGGAKDVAFDLTWSADWSAGEEAKLIVADAQGQTVAEGNIIPPALGIARIEPFAFAGDLSKWPAGSKLPAWVLGRLGAGASAEVYMGYNEQGLYLAAKVDGSAATVTDPKSFWGQDCLELCLDSANDKSPRKAYNPTDHQFWFCPMVAENRVYVGRWKRNNEIPQTQYDIGGPAGAASGATTGPATTSPAGVAPGATPGIKSFCKKTATGYIMEVLLPANQIKGFSAAKGGKFGLNLNITIPTPTGSAEIFWPQDKSNDHFAKPHQWGTVELK
jgi:hypothetical protein